MSGSNCENTFDRDLCLAGMKIPKLVEQAFTQEFAHRNLQREQEPAQQALPLSEIKSNALAQNTSLSEPKSKVPGVHPKEHPQELALWQRRAISKLDAIDTKTCTKVAGHRPSTK
ncbi:hypothetical protein L7F22_013413 [Adiantum nelumboides]|nr:hypothetical protein [Adiantum nelumboides]